MITFDTGALIALERRDRPMVVFMTALLSRGARITVPAVVVCEWWRGQRGPAARILDGVVVEPLAGALAKVVGATLARVHGATVIDTIVVASAARRGDVVLTADVEDVTRIRDAAFPAVRVQSVARL